MATAVLFMYSAEGRAIAETFSTPTYENPIEAAHALRASIADDWPGAIFAVGADAEAATIRKNSILASYGLAPEEVDGE